MLKNIIKTSLLLLTLNANASDFYTEKIKNPKGQFVFENQNISQNIEVLYFFSYDCKICYKTYGHFYVWEKYKKQLNVNFKKIPVGSKPLSDMFFLRKSFNYNTKMDNEIFKGLNLGFIEIKNNEDIIEFYEKLGKSKKEINEKLKSEKLDKKIKISKELFNTYKKNQKIDDDFLIVINYENDSYLIKNEKNKSPVDFIISINKTISEISRSTPD